MNASRPTGFRGKYRQDAEARAVYSEGAGIQRILPAAVAVPEDADDLSALVAWARREGASLIPRGSGSGMAGGAIGPGVIVDLSRWKAFGSVGQGQRRVSVPPGAICADVASAARAVGLRFPVSPSSAAFCTIGGMTATNAAGAHTPAFGSMRQWVNGVECVLADGSRRWFRRGESTDRSALPMGIGALLDHSGTAPEHWPKVRKNSSGYALDQFDASHDLVDLLVGSEGTLAFFTQIELRLTEAAGGTATIMGVFASLESAAEAAIRAREAGAVACELLDKTFLQFVAAASGKPFDPGTEAILLAESEGANQQSALAIAERIGTEFERAGATQSRVAVDAKEQHALWELRHAASPFLSGLSKQYRSMQFIEDGAVPPARLGDYIAGVRAALDRNQTRGVIFGHAGDAHIHVNPLVDVTASDWRQRLEGLLEDVTGLVASLGGTLSGEHGDGRLRSPLLPRIWDATNLVRFAAVKQAFDPRGMLNPGVKAAPVPLGEIKYDPALPPQPRQAANALATVERDRRYASFRLDLLDAN